MARDNIRSPREGDFLFERRTVRGAGYEAESAASFRLTVISSGSAIYTVGGKSYSVVSGDAVVTPEGALHRLIADGEVSYVRISVPPHYLSENIKSRFRSSAPVYRLAGGVREYAAKIEEEWLGKRELREELLRAYAIELAVYMLRSENLFREERESSPAVTSTLAYLKDHFGERISLVDMAKMAKVSMAYLSRKFKAEVGLGFADYLAALRLERAEEMLCERGEMSITEIAFACGFNDSNYFSDKFKKRFGLSPLKYRQQTLV